VNNNILVVAAAVMLLWEFQLLPQTKIY